MNLNVIRKPWFVITVLLFFSTLLTGCARPNDEQITDMLSNAYKCKWLKVESFKKTDSLPGIWTYVAQYSFNLSFQDGEQGALNFFEGLYRTTDGEKDWEKVLQNPKAYAYMKEGCLPPATRVLEQIAIQAYMQLEDKTKTSVQIPVSVPMTGWAEMSSGSTGWGMEVRRDKVDPNFVLSAPIKKDQLISKNKKSKTASGTKK